MHRRVDLSRSRNKVPHMKKGIYPFMLSTIWAEENSDAAVRQRSKNPKGFDGEYSTGPSGDEGESDKSSDEQSEHE